MQQFSACAASYLAAFTTFLFLLLCSSFKYVATLKVTATLISKYNYPVEEHTVPTTDHYILTIYRIPDSPHLKHCTNAKKPIVFLQHGVLSGSDDWVLSGPHNSLGYILADAGYDVWLGNARGNTYSRQHKHMSADSSDFWKFSWHEIGVYDLSAMLDYVLRETNQSTLHFVAHSQGTTTFFVLMSTQPQYNEIVRTVHLLAPIAFLRSHAFLLSKFANLFIGYKSLVNSLFGGLEMLPLTGIQRFMCDYVCSSESLFRFVCSGILEFIGGWGTKHLNRTLLPHVCQTHPAGASTNQIIHYVQLYNSGDFRQYDHGAELNMKIYQQEAPPAYNISSISSCVHLYYSHNDYMSAVEDVEYLASLLPCSKLYLLPYDDWNHYDFLWSNTVREEINDKILEKIENYESANSHKF